MSVSYKLIPLSVSLLSAAAVFIAGCDNRRETTAGSAPNASVGTTIDDSIITTKIKSGLLADPIVKGLDPKVETHKGTVQLSGFVEDQAQMDRVIEIARAVDGVKNVENKMSVKK
jgi:hyperosmotically inducible protein